MTDILVLILFVLSGAASGWLGVDLLPSRQYLNKSQMLKVLELY
jgi:hypothetical protein